VFDAAEIKALAGGGRGVTLMDLDQEETLLAALPIDDAVLVRATRGSDGKVVENTLSGSQLEAHHGHRARKGKLVDSKLRPPFALMRPTEVAG
jgi:topoisomerase-4 subunit A